MATVLLDFVESKDLPLDLRTWQNFKKAVGDDFVDSAKSDKSVYIIRMCRPYCIYYSDDHFSPVLYIGRGKFQTRITSHLKKWLLDLSKGLKGARFRVLVSQPRTNNNVEFYKQVEADLIFEFEKWAGIKPLNNGRHEKRSNRPHVYDKQELRRAFGLRSGSGYKWAIWPAGSNELTAKSWK